MTTGDDDDDDDDDRIFNSRLLPWYRYTPVDILSLRDTSRFIANDHPSLTSSVIHPLVHEASR